MPENDFEKQVQQLFDELRLEPSAEVWPKVSSRVRPEKRRRKILIWLPLTLLLLCAGSGYWLLQSNNTDAASGGSAKIAPTQVNSNNNTDAGVQALLNSDDRSALGNEQHTGKAGFPSAVEAIPDADLKTQGSGSDSHASNGPQYSVKSPVNDQALRNKDQQGLPVAQLPVSDHAGKPARVTREKNATAYPVPQNDQKGKGLATHNGILSSGNKDAGTALLLATRQSVDTKVSLLPAIETGEMVNGIPDKIIPETVLTTTAGSMNTPVKLAKKKTLEWGITGSGGVSLVTDGLLSFWGSGSKEKPSANAMLNSPNMSNNIGFLTGQSNSLVAALPPPASTVKKGLTWQAGGFVKWKMNARLAITGGLQYSYYSTRRAVGNDINNYRFSLNNTPNDVNASYAGYYIGGQNINYTNRYHFVEIPAGIQWQFNKSVQLPLQLNGGLSVSYLVNTTAVHYHEQTGSYYKDRSLFNKVQAGIHAGASAKLFAGSRRPLYVGPVVRYDLTNMLKPSVNLDQHFFYAGIKAEWVLGKK